MKYLILIATLILTISCSKNKHNTFPNPSYDEITLDVYMSKKGIPVKITTNTDEGNFEFEITENLSNKSFKVKNGYTFVANCKDKSNVITLLVSDKKGFKTLKSEQGNLLVIVSSK